jgi:uncharacterized protein
MTESDPIKDPSQEQNELPEELETPTAGESSETLISEPKPKARSRKKAVPAAENGAEVFDAPEPEKPEEPPAVAIRSEPLPAAPVETIPQETNQAPPYVSPPPQPLSEKDERTFAMLSHLSILLNLVTGFLGPVAALVIYFIYKDRSRYVRYHAMQSFVFQLIWWLGAGILAGITWTISGILAAILIGCLIMPIALFLTFIPLAALVYGVVGAIQTNEHQDFRYWLIGDWVRGELTGD